MARIMIVDDAMVARRVLRKTLVADGHEIVGEAATGSEAVEHYRLWKPDLVTMDITMPEMDGITATRMITRAFPKARIIITSAIGEEHMVEEAMRAGACHYVLKSYRGDAVLAVVRRVLSPVLGAPETASS